MEQAQRKMQINPIDIPLFANIALIMSRARFIGMEFQTVFNPVLVFKEKIKLLCKASERQTCQTKSFVLKTSIMTITEVNYSDTFDNDIIYS